MATFTITPVLSQISIITGYCITSEVKYGSNGSSGGIPEYGVGHDSADMVTGRRTWDSDLSNGVDSSWVVVELVAEAGGGNSGINWTVTGGTVSPVTYAGTSYGAIGRVRVRAAVQAPVQFQWRSLAMRFYKNGSQVDSFSRRAGPEVDRRGYPTPVQAEQVLEVVPAVQDADRLVVTGQVRLAAPVGLYPGPVDLFGQIFVDAANCTIL